MVKSIQDADRKDIGWPGEIIFAKLVKSPAFNILVKTHECQSLAFLPAFRTVEKKSPHKEIKEKPLLKEMDEKHHQIHIGQ